MFPIHTSQTEPTEESALPDTPFVIVHQERHLVSGNSSFRPMAQMLITPALRTSGLLNALPPEDVKNLLTLLTFVTPNGVCAPSVHELAHAMGVSIAKVTARMERLTVFQWQNEPLVYFLARESGLDAYTPSRSLAGSVHEVAEERDESYTVLPYQPASREEVIALSREKYARPREEVERQIAELNGWEVPEEFATEAEKERNALLRRLCATGMKRGQANEILGQYPVEVIRRQLDWLPHRGARYPAKFLASAIVGDYDAPQQGTSTFNEEIPTEDGGGL